MTALFRQNIVSTSRQSFISMGRVFPAALRQAKEADLNRVISVTDAFVIDRITITFYSFPKRLNEIARTGSIQPS